MKDQNRDLIIKEEKLITNSKISFFSENDYAMIQNFDSKFDTEV